MIVSKIYGGLAGQMLQYAVGRHLSLKNNTDLFLEISWYSKKNRSQFIRNFALDRFHTNYKELENFWLKWKIKIDGRLGTTKFSGLNYVREKDFSVFDQRVLSLSEDIVLDGYWNSYKYFEQIRSTLVEEFRPRDAPDEENQSFIEKINNSNSVSIHFRRGDYALTTFHGMLSIDYYSEAIKMVASKVADPHLFIFSDEPAWVISNLKFDYPYEVVDFNKDEKNYWDIELMKLCKHNIIANSGFSWWAAWLNQNMDKTVIAPERWINTEKTKIDNIPPDWILL